MYLLSKIVAEETALGSKPHNKKHHLNAIIVTYD